MRRPRSTLPDFSELTAWLPVATQFWQMWVAAPQVIAMRSARMLYSGRYPSARDQREFYRMFEEKGEALTESVMAMWLHTFEAHQAMAASFLRVPWRPISPWPALHTANGRRSFSRMIGKGIAPVHRRVTANAARLARGAGR